MSTQLDPLRAFNDDELRELLGGISPTTLWEIRDKRRLISSGFLYPGSRVRRTTARQIADYYNYLESQTATTPAQTAEQIEDAALDEKLDELRDRRRRHTRRVA